MTTFRARARTVDMLGRQQIAGIPTAISELFKNAHDAYALKVQADFVRDRHLLIVRDDGVGMTRESFVNRWLVLGTESKANADRSNKPPAGQERRPLLGEKGIGRLAIAAIGPQVLVVTYPQGEANDPGTMALVNWSLFEMPGLNLDEIQVPIADLPNGRLPGKADVAKLASEARRGLGEISELRERDRKRIDQELRNFEIDPAQLATEFPGPGETKIEDGGTQFYVSPTVETLPADLDERVEKDSQPPLVMTLLGFTNTMTRSEAANQIDVSFLDHKPGAPPIDVLDTAEFFTAEEFESADHHVVGTFDEFGQFKGTVGIYGLPATDHRVAWKEARGTQTECGPFSLELAVIQGAAAASRLPNDVWVKLNRKTRALGGLYIYSDGVRVLPYGRNDYDWLDIERNRTKSASYYYFSYRNMFGAIDVDAKRNSGLRQKAGREGFSENRAYRQMQSILRNFFLQIAADFFREDGIEAEAFTRERESLTKLEATQERRKRQQNEKKRLLRGQLDRAFKALENSQPEKEVEQILDQFVVALDTARTATYPDDVANAILKAESEARSGLKAVQTSMRVSRPRGFGLSRDVTRDLRAHAAEMVRLERDVLRPAEQVIESELADAAAAADGLDRRVRLEAALDEIVQESETRARKESAELRSQATSTEKQARALATDSVSAVSAYVEEVTARIASLDLSGMTEASYVEERSAIEGGITEAVDAHASAVESVTRQLRAVDWPGNGNGQAITRDDVTEALESEVEALREQAEQDAELAQLGMALEVVNHEFDSTVRAIRGELRRLRTWAEANPAIQQLYDALRASFDHLDGYLSLFTPLQRRLYRRRVEIAGASIEQFLRDLFGERLERDEIELRATARFRRHRFEGYPSSFYPVFVNLVDNAVFWVAEKPGKHWIELDFDGDAMLVTDSGPGVASRDREAVFEMGFTRKPGGRGAGLKISREVLAAENYDLVLDASGDGGATFRLRPTPAQTGSAVE